MSRMYEVIEYLGSYEAKTKVSHLESLCKEDFIEKILDFEHNNYMDIYWKKSADWRLKKLDRLEEKLNSLNYKIDIL